MSEYEEILAELKRLREEIADLRRAEYVARAGDADLLQGLAPDATGAADAHVVATDGDGNAVVGGTITTTHPHGRIVSPYSRELFGEKNIGDNVVTTIFRVLVPGLYPRHSQALLTVDLLLGSAIVWPGYVAVGERWLVALRAYTDGGGTKLLAAGAPVRIASSDAGSVTSSFADIGSTNLVVNANPADNNFSVRVQADHTGSSGGTVVCAYHALLSPMKAHGNDMSYMILQAA